MFLKYSAGPSLCMENPMPVKKSSAVDYCHLLVFVAALLLEMWFVISLLPALIIDI